MDINEVLEENEQLKQRVNELEEKLKSYTNPQSCQKFYEKNKEKIIEKIKANKPTPEKIKEYNKKSYQNRKLKKQLEEQLINNEK